MAKKVKKQAGQEAINLVIASKPPEKKNEKVESDYEAHPKFAKFKKSLGGN